MKHAALVAGLLFLGTGGVSLAITFFFLSLANPTEIPDQNSSPSQTSSASQNEIPEETTTSKSTEVTPGTSFTTAKLGTTESDLPYCAVNGTNLLMDIFWPNEGVGPFPLVLYVHGGGWTSGDKTDNVQQYVKKLTQENIAVAPVNYRLAKEGDFPAMIEDIKCAVRHLRAHAETYNIDPNRIGAFGGSAGGHLVSLLGTADASAGWDEGAYEGVSSDVAAVVEFFGPADLRIAFSGNSKNTINNVFGQTSYENMGFASPITYVTPNDPPFLIFHGEEDDIVPISQSEAFVETLEAADIDVTFVRVAHASHAFRPVNGGEISPSVSEIAAQMSSWFAEKLK